MASTVLLSEVGDEHWSNFLYNKKNKCQIMQKSYPIASESNPIERKVIFLPIPSQNTARVWDMARINKTGLSKLVCTLRIMYLPTHNK